MNVQEKIDRFEELREQQCPYLSGWNMAGYMPDNTPDEFEDFEDAKDNILNELRDRLDDLEGAEFEVEDVEAERSIALKIKDLNAAIEEVEKEPEPFSIIVLGTCYFITQEWEFTQEEQDELQALEDLLDSIEGDGDIKFEGRWFPSELIAEEYFEDHAKKLAEGLYDNMDNWPFTCIDWEQAASELQHDYISVEFEGDTYYYRG